MADGSIEKRDEARSDQLPLNTKDQLSAKAFSKKEKVGFDLIRWKQSEVGETWWIIWVKVLFGCNGAAKPRARARRGQATDPHSIAERLRREKIAERMKNLQELVPSSNKVSGSLLLSSSVGKGGSDISESEDSLAFEQEVVKLMETNVTTAMQYLQNKGLCLMPIALATAISNQKGFSTATPPDRRKPIPSHGMAPLSHSSMDRNCNKNDVTGCNGTIVKQEARESNDKTRELDHKAK
ncbi:hypothetical protein BHE74_00047962 [Ensete ventricosum]|uniref:Uncharacterized protein n=1 Tax=Ensete ventricosum TaxID=4639 RepID=A0A444FLQ2_ENSVE|nr:hypothetical protein B296_00049344 [Ensete ventricosum]RWW23575.1 hypothetical protein GW17_00012167 [Ensete ventricosum]RWW46132.1 hypothetical protein BHE74_00047962 [Ensete ventricosum]